MWPVRTLLLVGLGTLGALLLVVVLLSTSVSAQPSSDPSGCQATYHPVASCSVPSGGSIDPCSTVSLGKLHCAFTLPDFNPADWASWLGCQFVSQVSSFAGAIWNAIQTYVGNFLVSIANALFQLLLVPLATVENALAGAVVGSIQWFGSVVTSAFTSLTSASQPLGLFAPVVVVVATLAIFLVAGIGLYFVTIFLWAVFKTTFNLL